MGGSRTFSSRALGVVLVLPLLLAAGSPVDGAHAAVSREPHAPISVRGDADLVAQAAAEGWPGAGTAEDPYVIAGYRIDADGGPGVAIREVGLRVVVRDCEVTQHRDSADGILVSRSSDVVLARNVVRGGFFGIEVYDGMDVVVRENDVAGAGYGIVATLSDHVLIEGNRVEESSFGIDVTGFSRDVVVRGNVVASAGLMGIRAGSASGTLIEANVVESSGDGLRLDAPGGPVVARDNVVRSSGAGVRLSGIGSELKALVERNTLEDNEHGVVADLVLGPVIRGNRVTGGEIGVFLVDASDLAVTDNRLEGQRTHGIALEWGLPRVLGSHDNLLAGNAVSGARVGIHLGFAERNVVRDNVFAANGFGIALGSSQFGRTSGNVVRGNAVVDGDVGALVEGRASGNLLYDNLFRNARNALGISAERNAWSVEKRPGPNLVGGPFLGGNHWSDYVGADVDGDGLGEVPYAPLAGVGLDLAPLVAPV